MKTSKTNGGETTFHFAESNALRQAVFFISGLFYRKLDQTCQRRCLGEKCLIGNSQKQRRKKKRILSGSA